MGAGHILIHIRVHESGFDFVGFLFLLIQNVLSFSLHSTSRHLGKSIEVYTCQDMYRQGENARDIWDSMIVVCIPQRTHSLQEKLQH